MGRFIQRLGEAKYGRESGLVGELNLLACTGLPVLEGVVLSKESHREFMETSGLLQGIWALATRPEAIRRRMLETQLRYGSTPIEGELNRAICEALIELGASAVVVLSETLVRNGLTSIPEARNAVREAWLSLEGLKRQVHAAVRGEDLPTWPVLIQRELNPEYTGWSMARDSSGEGLRSGRPASKRNIVLHDIRPAGGRPSPDRKSIADLALEAEYLLGEPVRLEWGLKDGEWYILSAKLPSRR